MKRYFPIILVVLYIILPSLFFFKGCSGISMVNGNGSHRVSTSHKKSDKKKKTVPSTATHKPDIKKPDKTKIPRLTAFKNITDTGLYPETGLPPVKVATSLSPSPSAVEKGRNDKEETSSPKPETRTDAGPSPTVIITPSPTFTGEYGKSFAVREKNTKKKKQRQIEYKTTPAKRKTVQETVNTPPRHTQSGREPQEKIHIRITGKYDRPPSPKNFNIKECYSLDDGWTPVTSERTALALLPGGKTLMLDRAENVIRKFGSDGRFYGNVVPRLGRKILFTAPACIASDEGGRVYVAESDSCMVEIFDEGFNPISSFSTGINVNDMTISPDGSILLLTGDQDGFIRKYSSDGSLTAVFGRFDGENPDFQSPAGIAVDKYGYVYITDQTLNRVVKLRADGLILTCWGDDILKKPGPIATDSRGFIYVGDETGKISVFYDNGRFINRLEPVRGRTGTPSFTVTPDGTVHVTGRKSIIRIRNNY